MSAMKEEFINAINEDLDGQELKHTFGGGEFRITDQRAATWALRKIRQAKQRADEASATADAEMTIIIDWLARITADSEATIQRMEGYLRDYMMQQQAADPKLKSLRLPGGTLKTVQRTRWDYDTDTVMAWARENLPEAITTKTVESLARDTVKQHIKDTGEAVPGVMPTVEISFAVKLETEGINE